jgi:competence protein ComEC
VEFREIPFLRLTIPLCAGVIWAEYLPGLSAVVAAGATLALAVMALRLLRKGYQSDVVSGTALILFLVTAGYLLRTGERTSVDDLEAERQEITLRLSGYPDRGNSGCSIRARILSTCSADTTISPRGSMLLWFISDTIPSRWRPGDLLRIRARPVKIENNGNPCEFNYQRYMEGQGIKHMAFFRAGEITGFQTGSHRSVREKSLIAAHGMIESFRRAGLEGESLGLITALTIGDKDLLEKERLTSFSRSGAMHIMAVSGLHVGMISMALSWLLFFMKGRLKRARALIIVPALWGFAFITGLTPSVLRATIMFTFLQAGSMLNRPAASMNNLLASAFIITAFHPSVIFEAGFQLSYIAVGFIIAFYAPLYRLVKIRNKLFDYLWQMTAVSLVAQAGTLALSVRLFNIFPLLFLLTNIVVIPISFAVLVLAMLMLAASPLPALVSFIAMLLDSLADFTLGFTAMISSTDHGVISNIGMSATETILLTVTAALLLAALLRTARMTLRPFLVAATLLLACNGIKTLQEIRRDRVITYNVRGDMLTVRQHGRILLVPSSPGGIPPEVQKHACTRGLKIELIEPG